MTALHFEDVLAALRAAITPEEIAAARRAATATAACPKVKVKNPAPDVWTAGGARLPLRWAEAMEQNQQIASCCRHPENHEISAWYSCDAERAKGTPDLYVFHCPCGRVHRRLCCGGNPMTPDGEIDYAVLAAIGREPEMRPIWEVR